MFKQNKKLKSIFKKNVSESSIVERIYPGQSIITKEVEQEHIERYNFAKNYLKTEWIVLDAACGSGYGTQILSKVAKKIIGIDISKKAIVHAKKNFQSSNINFFKANLEKKLLFDDEYFDAIVSFETIEHLKEQESMIKEFARVLKKEGLLIISSPDKETIAKIKIKNPYHVKELARKEFVNLVSKYFSIENIFGQTKLVILPFWKRMIKNAVKKFNFLNLEKLILKSSLKKLSKNFSSATYSPITKINLSNQSNYYVIILKAQKL